jgi:hypothetical protein
MSGMEALRVLAERSVQSEHGCMSWGECEHEEELKAEAERVARTIHRQIVDDYEERVKRVMGE